VPHGAVETARLLALSHSVLSIFRAEAGDDILTPSIYRAALCSTFTPHRRPGNLDWFRFALSWMFVTWMFVTLRQCRYGGR
jgi:hypothetical protein